VRDALQAVGNILRAKPVEVSLSPTQPELIETTIITGVGSRILSNRVLDSGSTVAPILTI